MYKRLGEFVARRWLAIILAWMALVPTISCLAPAWDSVTNDGDLAYLPDRMTTVRGDRLMAQAFPDNLVKSQFVLVFERARGLTAYDLDTIERVAARFAPEADRELPVISVLSPKSEVVGHKFRSADRRAALVMINLDREFMTVANIKALAQRRARA